MKGSRPRKVKPARKRIANAVFTPEPRGSLAACPVSIRSEARGLERSYEWV